LTAEGSVNIEIAAEHQLKTLPLHTAMAQVRPRGNVVLVTDSS